MTTGKKATRVIWSKEDIDSITDAGIARYGITGWDSEVIRRMNLLQTEVFGPEKQRWLKSRDALVKVLPVLELKIKHIKEKEKTQVEGGEVLPLAPLKIKPDEAKEADWSAPPDFSRNGEVEELPPLVEQREDDALRDAVIEKVSDFFADILSLTVRKFLTNSDIARTLRSIQQYGTPDVVVESAQKHIHHNPEPAPKPTVPTVLICGFKPHQWPPFQNHDIAKKARLRFWHVDNGVRTLQSKLSSAEAAIFLMESAGHDQVQMARKAKVKVFAVSGGYEPAFRAVEQFLEHRNKEGSNGQT